MHYLSLLLSSQRNLAFPLLVPYSSKDKVSEKKLMSQETRREGSFRQLAVGSRGQMTYPAIFSILRELYITDLRYQVGVALWKVKLKESLFSSAAGSRMKKCVYVEGGGGRWNKENERIFL